jgi:integrase
MPQAVKSQASSADVPMPSQLGARLRSYLQAHEGKTDLLFVNRRGRPFSANKLREKQLHPLLVKLGIPRGGFHAARHSATSALLADGATPAVVQKQLRHSDPRPLHNRSIARNRGDIRLCIQDRTSEMPRVYYTPHAQTLGKPA